MNKIWSDQAWEDYKYWNETNKKILNKINKLIEDIERSSYQGLGKPEPLKYDWTEYWSRRITKEHRLVYKVINDAIYIAQCRYHY